MLLNWLKMVRIQIDYKGMKIKDWMHYRKVVKQSLRKFYKFKAEGYMYSMCFQAEEIYEDLKNMLMIYPKLTDRFIVYNWDKIEEPVNGFNSGIYDLLKDES